MALNVSTALMLSDTAIGFSAFLEMFTERNAKATRIGTKSLSSEDFEILYSSNVPYENRLFFYKLRKWVNSRHSSYLDSKTILITSANFMVLTLQLRGEILYHYNFYFNEYWRWSYSYKQDKYAIFYIVFSFWRKHFPSETRTYENQNLTKINFGLESWWVQVPIDYLSIEMCGVSRQDELPNNFLFRFPG